MHFFNWFVIPFRFPEIMLVETAKNIIKLGMVPDK